MNAGAPLLSRYFTTSEAARAGNRPMCSWRAGCGGTRRVRFGGRRRGDHRPKSRHRHRRLAADPASRWLRVGRLLPRKAGLASCALTWSPWSNTRSVLAWRG